MDRASNESRFFTIMKSFIFNRRTRTIVVFLLVALSAYQLLVTPAASTEYQTTKTRIAIILIGQTRFTPTHNVYQQTELNLLRPFRSRYDTVELFLDVSISKQAINKTDGKMIDLPLENLSPVFKLWNPTVTIIHNDTRDLLIDSPTGKS
jgi:hypothetical protein